MKIVLVCAALPYAKSADFAFDKEGGVPCSNLQPDYCCGVHNNLRKKDSVAMLYTNALVQARKYLRSPMKERIGEKPPRLAEEMFTVFPIIHF